MEVNQILDMLVQYGTPLVITAIVLYGAFRVLNIALGRFEQTHGAKKEKEQHDKLLEVRKSIDKSINTALERVLMRTNADRAFVFEFHNGGSNLGGLPFLKMSNTYEVVDTGIVPQKFNLEQMSLSMYSTMISEIMAKPTLLVNTAVREDTLPNICYETLLAQQIHTCVMARIADLNGHIIGYCGIDFVKNEKQIHGNSDIALVKELATELGALLSVDDE